ncbi:MAG: hypothetical protein D6732_06705 [Methanobacteriota archaeon]|nr:MAG: hypothetical protein D6732_06705 [Euryarchaeota archaeon]
MTLSVAKYTLSPMTNLHINRNVKRGGNYEVYKTHVSSSTILFGSRPRNLRHTIEKEIDYHWPSEGFFVTPAIPKEPLSFADHLETRVYNLIAPMGGILLGAVFAGKSATYTTTNVFGTPVKALISLALETGHLKVSDVANVKANQKKDKWNLDWKKAQKNPSRLMKLIRESVHQTLYESCPNTLVYSQKTSIKTIDMTKVMQHLNPDHNGPLPGLLRIEQLIEQWRVTAGRDWPSELKPWQSENVSNSILSDLNLYMYGWDHYSTTRTEYGDVAIYGRGSNDPIPTYGMVEYIRPRTEFQGYLVCKEDDIPEIQNRFSRILHFGTFASTNETIVRLGDFTPVEETLVSNMPTVALQYPMQMFPEMEITEMIERTERYAIVRGKYSGKAIVVDGQCIPIDAFFHFNMEGGNGIPIDRFR